MKPSGVFFALFFLVIAGVVIAVALTRHGESESNLQKLAAISMETAKREALGAAPGDILSGGLELEHGALVFSFDIETGDKSITKVRINAKNGSVVSAVEESAKDRFIDFITAFHHQLGRGAAITGSIPVKGDKDLERFAKIGEQDAERAALYLVAGTVKKTSLENDDGYLVFNVRIYYQETDYEVLVDAGTATVLAIVSD